MLWAEDRARKMAPIVHVLSKPRDPPFLLGKRNGMIFKRSQEGQCDQRESCWSHSTNSILLYGTRSMNYKVWNPCPKTGSLLRPFMTSLQKRKLGEETDIGIRAMHRLRAWHVTYLVTLNKFTKERKKCNFPEFFLPIWYNLFCVCSESLSLEINLIWLS